MSITLAALLATVAVFFDLAAYEALSAARRREGAAAHERDGRPAHRLPDN